MLPWLSSLSLIYPSMLAMLADILPDHCSTNTAWTITSSASLGDNREHSVRDKLVVETARAKAEPDASESQLSTLQMCTLLSKMESSRDSHLTAAQGHQVSELAYPLHLLPGLLLHTSLPCHKRELHTCVVSHSKVNGCCLQRHLL